MGAKVTRRDHSLPVTEVEVVLAVNDPQIQALTEVLIHWKGREVGAGCPRPGKEEEKDMQAEESLVEG